ncbi:uncharacterized protein CC84DRAFT_1262488 [Paraphaeosphaeria sporulosa]|uniref:Cora-domain-containing protein n=1 Tax=Paraphaeosphaeria sporulosa TaxID=1460663 RepID=A0A177C400_9PLEO|nr:uncharacterized protein CC84DRAFT_1262488 [Paraphaeosphaeria sporulosa]OAG01400.1 hypothetical protein CC84DRAFT_1262488 [Paraphaeosphaeria sporulosa]
MSAYFEARQWEKNFGLLEANDGHLLVSITKKDAVNMSQSYVNDEQLLSCLSSHESTSSNWTLKLLITRKSRYSKDDRRIPYPAEILEAFITYWKIADIGFRAQARAGSCSLSCSPVPGDSSYTGLIVRLVYGLPFRGMLIITHDRNTNATYAVCFGIASEHANRLVARLEESQSYASSPIHVALLLSDIALEDLEQFSTSTYCDFVSVREAMGTNLYSLAEERVARAPDLTDMPRRLTALANALASNCSSLNGVVDIVDTMELYSKDFQKSSTCETSDIVTFADRMVLMRQTIRSALRRNEYVKASVEAQVQMVYALRAQQDNEMSHQYGADMRVISIVTLIFLPGTFVATLFSTSFWDFGPLNEGPLVSKWVWLYWVVTIVLTMCVVSVWMWWPWITKLSDMKCQPFKDAMEMIGKWRHTKRRHMRSY